MLRCKNIGGTLTSPAGNLGVVQPKVILPNLNPKKLTCGEPLQHKSNLLQSPLPSKIAGLTQYKTIKLFTTTMLCSVRRRLPPPPPLLPPPLFLSHSLSGASVSRLVIARLSVTPSFSLVSLCAGSPGPSTRIFSSCVPSAWVTLCLAGTLVLVPFLFCWWFLSCWWLCLCSAVPLRRFVPPLFRPRFGCWCFWCSPAVALPPFPFPPSVHGGAASWFSGILPLLSPLGYLVVVTTAWASGLLVMPHDLYFVRSCAIPAGLEIGYALFPFLIVLHGNKGFGPVWGIALYTMLRLLIWFLAFPF